jgi:tripartite-type tricarboxylate transporter receptor subunit TctC
MSFKQAAAAIIASSGVLAAGPTLAQTYLTQPVRIVVPTGPGSVADTVTRLIGQGLSTQLSQTFIVENRVGANGIVGADAVAKAAPDGTTLIVGNVSTHAINAALYPKLPYDPVRDFTPVSLVGFVPYILVVSDGVAAKNPAELMALARSQPGKLTYATGSAPSIVAMEMIKRAAGVEVLQVNYKTVPQGMIDVLSGRIDMMVADTGVALPQIRSGKVRAVMTVASVRTPLLPDVPSLPEAGLPRLDVIGWWGWYAPAGTPAAAVNRVYEALVKVTAQKELRDRVAEFGAELKGGTPAELMAFTQQQSEMYARIIKEAGIKPE